MRHLVSGRKLKRTSSHRKALLANLATELFRHKSIRTTEAKAKELRPYAESIITRAKNALLREKQGLLPDGHTIDIHSRRIVAKQIRVKEVLSELFDSIAPAVIDRPGGYARVVKTGIRRGDAARTAIIELVDFSAPQDGAFGMKKKKKNSNPKPTEKVQPVKANPAIEDAPVAIEEAKNDLAIQDATNDVVVADDTTEVALESASEVNGDSESVESEEKKD